jgi:hypothetical protein
MKKQSSLLVLVFPFLINAQNVGIGTTTPSEKLDVNGNINVTGTIKVNGTDGTAGQALMKNSTGTFSWGNVFPYNNVAGFRSTNVISNTVYSWTVPVTVTKLFVEAWGGGGGGASGGGGGGGGYAACQFTVVPGNVISITVGGGGTGALTSGTDAIDGLNTVVLVNGIQQIAYGGEGGHGSLGGIPGGFSTNSAGAYIYGLSGVAGSGNTETYGLYSATVYYTAIKFGNGGEGGNTMLTQYNGGFRSYNTSTNAIIKNVNSQFGSTPGGGGGGDFTGGKDGGPGMVLIHY